MTTRPEKPAPVSPVRCAIYTRKSTEENLELDFNSLDAQREAAEAYIASQKSCGWTSLPERYDDGGYSGGTTDRPAFQRLLADVEAGRIDCVVVYKIDRLSRSLLDFAKIMEVLDRRNVSLVAVTQQFNTTTSMGRLTLNILLSFAQFEREIISERTRDKIAAARRKGQWTGGPPILGYDRVRDPRGTRLVVNPQEAPRVRAIFEKYLQAGSLMAVAKWLDQQGWRNKSFTTARGKARGGQDFDKSTLQKMLTNPLYLGKIHHAGQLYTGQHAAIVDEDLFGRVQGMLARNRHSGGAYQRNKYGALLKGLVRCAHCGCGMVHHYAAKGAKRYRYYVCLTAQKKGWSSCPYPSLPAGELEQFVIGQIRATCTSPELWAEVVRQARAGWQGQHDDLVLTRTRQESHLRQIQAEIDRRAQAAGTRGPELAALQAQAQQAQAALALTQRQLNALAARTLSDDELLGACEAFEPLWDRLLPDERAQLVHLVVQCVEYDGQAGQIALHYHPGNLAQWHPEEAFSHA